MGQKTGKGKVYIGTSGWHYLHWKGLFYPQQMPAGDFLSYYSRHFQTAEVNNTFYRLPGKEVFAGWRDAVPGGFVFSVKASRFITHVKRLQETQAAMANLLVRAAVMGNKLGPVLFQLPPHWKMNPERLESFLAALSPEYRYTFEFRDTSWLDEITFDLLSRYNAALCLYDFAGTQSPRVATAGFVYIRLHGPAEMAYGGQYGEAALDGWANDILQWSREGKDVYCYFDNDEAGYAAQDALRLKKKVGA